MADDILSIKTSRIKQPYFFPIEVPIAVWDNGFDEGEDMRKDGKFKLIATIAMVCAVIQGLGTSASAADRKSPNREILHRQAMEESLVPVRPGIPGRIPFWNRYAIQFMYAPAFDFQEVEGAINYRFSVHSPASGKDYMFVAAKPWEALSPIWRDLPVGYLFMRVEGLNRRGDSIGIAGSRNFYRAAVFHGPYGAPVSEYRQSARRALRSLFRQKYIQRWKKDGKPDPDSNGLFSYPSKIIGGIVDSMLIHAKLSSGSEAAEALGIAKIAARYLMEISEPAGSPLEFFPPTYAGGRFSADRQGQIMVPEAAKVGNIYLDLFAATKDEMFLKAAEGIADTYLRTQTGGGTWPLMVESNTGKPLTENVCIPVENLFLFDRLIVHYHLDRYQSARDKVFRWLMDHPMRTFDWAGQFEDQSVAAPEYNNLTQHEAVSFSIYLFDHCRDDPFYLRRAEELLRFAEDQFVIWEQPLNPKPKSGAIDRNSDHWLRIPCALEQYHYYVPIDASAAKMILGFTKAYKVTGNSLYRAKACSLADSMTRVQVDKGPNAGLYMVAWADMYRDERHKPFTYYWVNCLVHDVRALLALDEVLAGEARKK